MSVKNTSSSVGPKLIRIMNQRTLLGILFDRGVATRPELSADSGLSQPTVIAALEELITAGLVRQLGHDERALGRPARLYEANASAGTVTAIDIGRVWLRAAVVDLRGHELSRADIRNHARSTTELIELISDTVAVARRGANLTEPSTFTIIGSPGVFVAQRGMVDYADQLPGWHHPKLIEMLEDALGKDIVIENDVNLAACGEANEGVGRGLGSFAYLHIGTGVGLATVIDGKVHRGASGAAGELAYTLAQDPQSKDMVPLEDIVSARALEFAAKNAGLDSADPAEILALPKRRLLSHQQVIEDFCDRVAAVIVTITAVFDPERIVLGGGIGRGLGPELPNIAQRVTQQSPFQPNLVTGSLGSEAVLRGAVHFGLSQARNLLFSRSLNIS